MNSRTLDHVSKMKRYRNKATPVTTAKLEAPAIRKWYSQSRESTGESNISDFIFSVDV